MSENGVGKKVWTIGHVPFEGDTVICGPSFDGQIDVVEKTYCEQLEKENLSLKKELGFLIKSRMEEKAELVEALKEISTTTQIIKDRYSWNGEKTVFTDGAIIARQVLSKLGGGG